MTHAVHLMGAVRLIRDEQPVDVGGPKQQAVLAVLALSAGRRVSTDRLVDIVWDENPPASARRTIQSYVASLRSASSVGSALESSQNGYTLKLDRSVVDLLAFEDQVAGLLAQVGLDPDDIAQGLAALLASWETPLDGLRGAPRLADLTAPFEELRLQAVERLAAAQIAGTRAGDAVKMLEALVREYPTRENLWLELARGLNRLGRRDAALKAIQRAREALREHLGVHPSAQLAALETDLLVDDSELIAHSHDIGDEPGRGARAAATESALADEAGLGPSAMLADIESQILDDDPRFEVAAQPSSGGRGNRTARQLLGVTEFVGRDDVIGVLDAAISEQQLMTITGPGGVGKTRLATRLAGSIVDGFVDGVTVVELASRRDAAGAAQAIARALDVQPQPFRTIESTVEEHLTSARMLLLLDNCEHLIDALAPIVDRLRSTCPHLRILATSREPLGLAGEYVHVLGPLDVPQRSATNADKRRSDAVVLFVDRATTATPDFVLTDANVDLVVEVCERLDGLPLALELATARLRTMGLRNLAVRLNQRTEMNGQTQRGADERHRTMHQLVEWSYELLSAAEQRVFEQLSVFAGGFDLTAAEAVCSIDGQRSSIAGHVVGLVDKSMVVMSDPMRPRYRVLEPLREFGLDRLDERGEVSATEARHLGWFLGRACDGAAGLDGPDESTWSDDLDLEFDNFRAAHLTAVRHDDAPKALSLVAALSEFAIRRVRYEITSWAEASAAMASANDQPDLPTAVGLAAYGLFVKGEMENAVVLARRAKEIESATDAVGCGLPERVLGNALFYLERTDEAMRWLRPMVTAARRSADPARVTHALYMQSVAVTSTGDSIHGAQLADEAWEAAERAGSPTALAQANYARGLAIESVDPAQAFEYLVRSSQLAAGAGNRWIEAFALTEVHWLQARRGEPMRALRGYADVVDLWYRGGDWANQWLSLRRVLGILLDVQMFEPAAVLHGALTAVGASRAMPFEPADAESLETNLDALRSRLDPAQFTQAMERGGSMTHQEVITFVKHEIALLTTAESNP